MIKFITAGESHGKGLTTIVSGFPSNLILSKEYIDQQLKRRQQGYGRGLRMKIEADNVEILSGIRHNKTLGSPISMLIWNKDWENWIDVMSVESPHNKIDKVTVPRPGHADLAGISKYNFNDIRNSIERSSARETASRVAACSVAKRFLEEFGICVGSFVESIGGVFPHKNFADNLFLNKYPISFTAEKISKLADRSTVRVLDKNQEERIVRKIKTAKKKGDTLGGTFYVIATGVPVGLGSFISYDTKLDAELAHAVISINAVKGVEIGLGFKSSELFGSEMNDEIIIKQKVFTRKTNRAGGIEGGISNGLPIVVKAAMKPIPTLMSPLQTIDLRTMKSVEARRERSDFVAVPACAVIAESMVAWVLAKSFLEKFGGDSMDEVKDNYRSYTNKLFTRIKKNFSK